MTQADLDELNQRKQELEQQIEALMKDVRPLKRELAKITETIYRIHCEQARELPVWELRVSTAKTIQENKGWGQEKIVLCSGVTWQEMFDTAVRYFSDNGIEGWTLGENSYKDCGQFCYKDGYNGGPVLGVFQRTNPIPPIIHDFDYESIARGKQ